MEGGMYDGSICKVLSNTPPTLREIGYLENAVFTRLLFDKNIQSFGRVSGSDNTIRHLAGDNTSCGEVARSRQRNEVTKR